MNDSHLDTATLTSPHDDIEATQRRQDRRETAHWRVVIVGLIVVGTLTLAGQLGGQGAGMVYAGLEQGKGKPCAANMLEIEGTGLCTHGPDPAPDGFAIDRDVPPIGGAGLPAPQLSTGLHSAEDGARPKSARPQSIQSITCDGDGVSGNRVQVMYVRAADRADRYSQYLASIRQWTADMDQIFHDSAVATGGDRHVRLVHDSNCVPVVLNVVVTATGDDNFNNMITELRAMGYNLSNRKYLIFADANVYCGIGTFQGDDRAVSTNVNNTGPSYARADAGCWDGGVAAHEVMHNLGGVQLSSPHSSGGAHCTDEYDRMCYSDSPNYPTMAIVCGDSGTYDRLFDCNHDDYFHTNPTPGSYLATHWNSAGNRFLLSATMTPTPTPTPVLGAVLQVTNVLWAEMAGNGNGTIDPSERISVTLRLQNVGTQTATGITGTLSILQGGATIQQAVAGWPNIPVGNTGLNAAPYTFIVSPTQACGGLLSLHLALTYVGTAALGYDFNLRVGREVALGTQDYAYHGPPVPIPDNDIDGVAVPITISAQGEVVDLDVHIDITHTWDGDLALYLLAPDNTEVPLVLNEGDEGDNFTGTVLDDEASIAIAAGTAPFTGHYRPDFSLSLMDTKPVSGTWKLLALDLGPQDLGTLYGLTLTVTSRLFQCDPALRGDCNGDVYVNAGDVSAMVLELFDGDGNLPANVSGGSFAGNATGCNANHDGVVDAGDLSCVLSAIYGLAACMQ